MQDKTLTSHKSVVYYTQVQLTVANCCQLDASTPDNSVLTLMNCVLAL